MPFLQSGVFLGTAAHQYERAAVPPENMAAGKPHSTVRMGGPLGLMVPSHT